MPSFLVIAALFAITTPYSILHWPQLSTRRWRWVMLLSAIWLGVWLIGGRIAAQFTGGWITYADGWPLIMAFVIFGLVRCCFAASSINAPAIFGMPVRHQPSRYPPPRSACIMCASCRPALRPGAGAIAVHSADGLCFRDIA
ncbi:MAG: hypothetical protein U5N85_02980 [Arcicella sp.]|nr:hypothetical protein [Arcicella sp.]